MKITYEAVGGKDIGNITEEKRLRSAKCIPVLPNSYIEHFQVHRKIKRTDN